MTQRGYTGQREEEGQVLRFRATILLHTFAIHSSAIGEGAFKYGLN
jgi:hypothetical protein